MTVTALELEKRGVLRLRTSTAFKNIFRASARIPPLKIFFMATISPVVAFLP